MEKYSIEIAELFLRLCLGAIFVIQGYDKLFSLGIGKVSETFEDEFRGRALPKFIFPVTAFYSSLVEFIGGILLVIGLFKYYIMILIGVDLLLVTIAFSLLDPGGNLKMVFSRWILWVLLLLLPQQQLFWGLDSLLKLN